MAELELKESADFRLVASRLRKAPKDIRTELNKAIREASKDLVADQRRAVLGLASSARAAGGRRQRLRYAAERSKKGIARGTGSLRATIARSLQVKIAYSGVRTGVRVRVNPLRLPPDQRRLPRALDGGKWRHPVMGDRDVWVTQTAGPVGWFSGTARRHTPAARRAINAAARKALQKLDGKG